MNKIISMISARFFAICSFLWGQLDGLFYALIAFMILDYLTGIISAYIAKKLSSEVGFRGIAKKVLMLILVAVGHIIDIQILGGGAVCRSAVIGFYLANEGLSILENAGKIGLPLPEKLLDVLEQLRKDDKNAKID